MAVTAASRRSEPSGSARQSRLGLQIPAGWWPTPPRLKALEAAGFGHVQMRIAASELLSDRNLLEVHAAALRDNLGFTGLRLILHVPPELVAGPRRADAQLEGAVRYAQAAGSELLVVHAAGGAAGNGRGQSLVSQARSLKRLARHAAAAGVRIALENGAPVYPGHGCLSHDPAAIGELVRRLDCAEIGMCLDVGHGHIAAGRAGRPLAELIEPLLDRVILFHLHDNFGARSGAPRAGGIEPIRLDLHLAPGAGSVPWTELAPLLAAHPAPLQLEVHPVQPPAAATLAIVMCELLGIAAPQSSGA